MTYDRPQDYGSQTGYRSGDMGERGAGRVHQMREKVKEKTSQVSRQVQQGASRAKDWFSQTVDEYPLALGGAFVLLGLASGFALPATKPERRIMGKTGRRIMSQAQEVGSQVINRGEEAAERTVETVKGAMKREGRSGR